VYSPAQSAGRKTERSQQEELKIGRPGNRLGVQVNYNVVHLRTSLVQLFVLLFQNFEKVVQMIELKRFGGSPNGYPFAPLQSAGNGRTEVKPE
jgi:hypothetical protein